MRNTKKLTVLLTAVMVGSLLGGCTPSKFPVSKEYCADGEIVDSLKGLDEVDDKVSASIIEAFNKKYEGYEPKTMEAVMGISADLGVSAQGINMSVGMDIEDEMEAFSDGSFIHQNLSGKVTVFGFGVDLEAESYTKKDGKSIVTYSKTTSMDMDEESKWEKEEGNNSAANIPDSLVSQTLSEDSVDGIYYDEDEEVYVVVLKGDALADAMDDMEDSLSSSMSEGMDGIKTSIDYDNVDAYVTLDKGLAMIGYYVDMSDAIEITVEDDSEGEMTVNDMTVTFQFVSFDEDLDDTIPKAVIQAAEEDPDEPDDPDDPDDPFSIIGGLGGNTPTDPVEPVEPEDPTDPVIPNLPVETEPETASVTPSESLSKVNINGKTISLPTTLDALRADGWVIDTSLTDAIVEAGRVDFAYINLDDYNSIGLTLSNLTESDLSYEDCVVSRVSYDCYDDYDQYSFNTYGIKMGMTKTEAEQILGSPASSYSEDEYSSCEYLMDNGISVEISYVDSIVMSVDVGLEDY